MITPENIAARGRPLATGTCQTREELEEKVNWYYNNTVLRAKDLADKYDVSIKVIYDIIGGDVKERWKHYVKTDTRDRQALILEKRERGETLREIAEQLGISRQRVHQIEEKAKRLRDSVEAL